MRIILAFFIMFILISPNLLAEDTGSDADFKGAEVAVPKEKVKTLDNTDFVDKYSDFSEFQEGSRAQEEDIEAFYHLGRMLGVGIDAGIGGFTGTYSESNVPGLRWGIRGTYFFSLTFAIEVSYHYQKNDFEWYYDDVKGWFGDTKLSFFGLGGKYYIDTRSWSDFVSMINPHIYIGIENINMSVNSEWGPSNDPPTAANGERRAYYAPSENIWAATVGLGFEFRLTNSTYFSTIGKYHFGRYTDEDVNLEYPPIYSGDVWSFDGGLVFYF